MESIVSLSSSSLLHLPFPSTTLPPLSPLRLPLHPHRHARSARLVSHSTAPSSAASTLPITDAAITGEKFDWYAHWYPVAPVCDLDKRAPHAKRVLGLDIVVWWDREKEQWQVFDDRCPHRLAPLSEGRIDQWGRLQCVYHGWCFDGSGDCKYIPQAPPDGPPVHTFKKACAAVYPSIVQNKILWFWPSTDHQYKDIALKEKPPYVPQLDDPSYTCTMGMRDLQYGYEILTENLMDPAHVPYAHYGLLTNVTTSPANSTRDREGGKPLEMTIETLDKTGFLSRNEMGYSKFTAPCLHYSVATLGSRNESVSSQSTQEDSSKTNKKQKSALLVFLCVPVSPGRSRIIYVFPRNFSVWVDQVFPRWFFHIRQNLVLDSDLYLLHLEEQKIAELGPSNWLQACYVPTKSDAKVIAFRRWLKKYADDQIHWGTKFNNYLPPSPPKEQIMDRYWSHTVQCSSCHAALKGMKVLKVVLQVISVVSIGILAAMKQNSLSTVTRFSIAFTAVLCFLASRWLSHFIYKNFYYHDYNHAFV